MTTTLSGKNVLVLGGTGFLGSHLVQALRSQTDAAEVFAAGSRDVNLTDFSSAFNFFWARQESPGKRPFDLVFNVSAWNGGLQANKEFPGKIFWENTLCGLNALEACRRFGVEKVVSVIASCSYPAEEQHYAYGLVPREIMREKDLLDGPTHETVACHGYAKRNVFLASRFFAEQYGMKAVCACPGTLFGERDSFDPVRTKVVGGMVKRYCDAVRDKAPEVSCWGTGRPLREVLYAGDCARLLVEVMRHYDDTTLPLNISAGQELSIKDLAETVGRLAGYSGRTVWRTDKPDGQMRKRLDLTRMKAVLPPFSPTPLEEGLARTIRFYRGDEVMQ